ncbi:cytochrome b/b6 domain-containing protein [Microbacterium sp. bgisy203]|uniref:cytochrome b/b6 domain-containing protein n=1 Tax=Microbacterium sp. bgisy203 TaxID=3413799 RepID=UPI003D71545A
MATYGSALRRGLPRTKGGDGWPPAGSAVEGVVPAGEAPGGSVPSDSGVAAAAAPDASRAESVAAEAVSEQNVPVTPVASAPAVPAAPAAASVSLRRGLPRRAGGDPWPPAGASASGVTAASPAAAAASDLPAAATGATSSSGRQESVAPVQEAGATPVGSASAASVAAAAASGSGEPLRRGLPRTAEGEPWPPAGTVSRVGATSASGLQESVAPEQESGAATVDAGVSAPGTVDAGVPATAATSGAAAPAAASAPAASTAVATHEGPREPLTVPKTVWAGRAASHRPEPEPEPARIGPFTKGQWAGVVIIGGLGLLIAAGMAVAFVRFLLSLEPLQDFLATYPGEYHLPEGAPVGFPAWLGWQHFFNVFLMVLIIRSGLTIRNEKRPAVFWTPKNDPKGKTSLTIWFHQSLDLLWIINGVIFVVLLFVTGQWMRIVPTSWEVFPNALSAMLQYISLDWPTENGWVNYNALQQIAYFTTVFIAAPLAIITGFRMSGLWPKKNEKLSRAYPIEWARKVHFPTMLYFVVFIAIHVFLVFATGALRNLNHMYAAQGSVDPNAYADNWTGFWMFVASMVVIAAAWVALRPMTIAPIARLFGTVSGR